MPAGLREALRGCTHRIRLQCDTHNACFKCRLRVWGLEGLCTPTRRCTECVDQPPYVFDEITDKIEQGRKRAAQRARARDRSRQRDAERRAAADNRVLQRLDTVPLGGPTGHAAGLFPDPPAQPSATSTPGHDADDDISSFHASDFLSPPGVDQNITYVSIDEMLNTTDIINALTPSGMYLYRLGHHRFVASG